MSDEKIQIEIADEIDASIQKKLNSIATAAETGFSHIERLKTALRSIDSSAINALSLAQSRAQKAMNDSAIVAAKLATEQQKQAQAAIQAATAQQRLQTAATQTATAQQQLTTASANATAAQTRSASAALRLQQQQAKAAAATTSLAREAEALKRELFPLYAAHQQYNEAVARANILLRQGAIDTQTYNAALTAEKSKLESTAAATRAFNIAQVAMGRNAQLNRAHLVNLGFQLNDIGVSLAGGQNPLVVLIQQGSQIAGIASQAGVGLGRLALEAGKMVARFVPLAAAIGLVVGGIELIASETTQKAGPGLKAFAEGLGFSSREIKKLHLDTVTFTDSFKGLWKTINDATGVGDLFSKLWEQVKSVFTDILKFIAGTFSSIIALGRASVDFLVAAWDTLPGRIGKAVATLFNSAISSVEGFVNSAIDGINTVITALNLLNGINIDLFQKVDLGRIDTKQFEDAGTDLSQLFVNSYVDNLKSNQSALDKFIAKWQENSVKAAKARITKAAETSTGVESRATSLAKVNAELDNEIQRMFLLKPAREAQAKLDQIEEQLIGKKITLTKEEGDAIRAKINVIQEATTVQAKFDEIYQAAIGPARDYNATLEAADKLLTSGAISSENYSRSIRKATESYLNSLDPLRQINKEIDQQNELLKLLPREREVEQQIQQIGNTLLAEGILLTDKQTKALRERLKSQQELNIASQAEAQIFENTRGARQQFIAQLEAINKLKKDGTITGGEAAQQIIAATPELDFNNTQTATDSHVQQFADMYAKIDELRQKQLISEQTAATLRLRVWSQTQAQQLSVASNFFGSLSALQNSQNKKIAKIGKAAAIAKAIIDTYTGATAAYAALAGIPIVGPALGIAAAAAAIAGGLANVQAIRSQPIGFQAGGYTGNGAQSAVAGAVHGQEYVMNAESTRRIGVANLDAMQRSKKTSGIGGIKVEIANYGTSKDFEVQHLSESAVRIIARDEAERSVAEKSPRVIAAELANPNSRVSKSMNRNTNTTRSRN